MTTHHPLLERSRAFRSCVLAQGGVWLAVLSTASQALAEDGIQTADLAPRSVASGATMFTRLSPDETGIVVENNYADPRMWGERYQELTYGAIGTGVAIGDYDNDGRPDVYVVSKTEQSRLFRNLGGFKFEDVTEKAGLAPATGLLAKGKALVSDWFGPDDAGEPSATAWKQGAVFADVNNDGWLDLYVCCFDAPNLLYLNQGDGTFAEEAEARGLAVRDACGVAAFCDYDRDGWLDVYVQTNLLSASTAPNGQADFLFRNRGDGTFEDVTRAAGISGVSSGHSATWWDFDADGWPDLYVANDFAVPDRLYRNNGDGTFTERLDQVVPRTPYYAMGSDLGDVDNDGRFDLFVGDMAPTTHEKDQRGMAGSRARAQLAPSAPGQAAQRMQNALYLSTGCGRVLEAAQMAGLAATDWTWSVRFEDLDNDGWLDLHVTNGMSREYHNADLLARSMGAESPQEARNIVKLSPVLAEANLAFRNRGDLQFDSVGPAWGLDEIGVSFGAAFGDLDGDGDLDLVYGNYQNAPSVLRNDSPEGHRLVVSLRGTRSNRQGIGAVVRLETDAGVQVRQLVSARGYLSSSEPLLHFGLGTHDRISKLEIEWPSGSRQSFSNLAVNRRYTVTEPPSGTNDPIASTAPASPLFREVGTQIGFAEAMPTKKPEEAKRPGQTATGQNSFPADRPNRRAPALAIGDLDGDGREDVVVGEASPETAHVKRAGADGVFTFGMALTGREGDGAAYDGPLLIFDANGDGRNDILVTMAGRARANPPAHPGAVPQPKLWLSLGEGRLAPAAEGMLPQLNGSVGAAVAGDFDHDGRLDLFLGGSSRPGEYPNASTSVLLMNRGGRFEETLQSGAPGLSKVGRVSSALATDVNGDGWLDLLLALEWGGVRYWENQAGRGFEDRSETAGFAHAGHGWWTSLAGADFNSDGRMDYVAGNVGLNTPYRASRERPALLLYGDFTGTGNAIALETRWDQDRLVPRASRTELGALLPPVNRRFARNDAYARASMEDLVGKTRFKAAEVFSATEFQSGVFLSTPEGTWRFQPLPRNVQVAPVQGLVARDFDGDGSADIVALHNDFSPPPAIGRFDGGLGVFLRGDGEGGFTAVSCQESGVSVTGDAQALGVVDIDGNASPDLVLTRAGEDGLALRNEARADARWFEIVLADGEAGAHSVGSQLMVRSRSGRVQMAEVYAGGGYLSQSTTRCFFASTDADPLETVIVHWPDGSKSNEAFAPVGQTLRLRKR